jgi:hypothetical protein
MIQTQKRARLRCLPLLLSLTLGVLLLGIGWHTPLHTHAAPAAPLPNGGQIVGYASPQFGSKQYAYADQQGHIEELSFMGGIWVVADLFQLV